MSDERTSKTLVERLREVAGSDQIKWPFEDDGTLPIANEAADEIERLQSIIRGKTFVTADEPPAFRNVSPGEYDDTMECVRCSFRYMESADASPEENARRAAHECRAAEPPSERHPLRINGAQVAALVDFLDLNGTPEAKETPLHLQHYGEDRMCSVDKEPMPAGLYAWFAEYPEEGQLLLDPEPRAAVTKSESSDYLKKPYDE